MKHCVEETEGGVNFLPEQLIFPMRSSVNSQNSTQHAPSQPNTARYQMAPISLAFRKMGFSPIIFNHETSIKFKKYISLNKHYICLCIKAILTLLFCQVA